VFGKVRVFAGLGLGKFRLIDGYRFEMCELVFAGVLSVRMKLYVSP
jgi:hypothetical protein